MLPTTPYQYAPTYPTYNPIQNNIPEIQYVNSPESADAYNLPPNKTAVLFNQNCDEFYIVSSDASGSRTRNDFTFKTKARNGKSEYVTRAEFRELKNMVENLTGNKKYAKKEEVSDNE